MREKRTARRLTPRSPVPIISSARFLLVRRGDAPPRGPLAGMRIRKKLIVLHTCFSLGLAVILLVAMRPAVGNIVRQAESEQAALLTRLLVQEDHRAGGPLDAGQIARLTDGLNLEATVRTGGAEDLGLDASTVSRAAATPREPIPARMPGLAGSRSARVAYVAQPGVQPRFYAVSVPIGQMRAAVRRLYVLFMFAMLAVYVLVAATLEVFVLPQHVYSPIRRILRADHAVREGSREGELIPESQIPADEVGQIMRSRNDSIRALRRNEHELGVALGRLEGTANDLRRKNHLLETARRNLADADRLASLGMMSAGLAHEMNTPLSVLKGLGERLNRDPSRGIDAEQAALVLRVVNRLERLSESLLDFARVRPPRTRRVGLRELVDEALTLVHLDRRPQRARLNNHVPETLTIQCEPDRMIQVLVNLVRNASDAIGDSRRPGRVDVEADTYVRDGQDWASITIRDDGPGIAPEVLTNLFDPFVSTRLDAEGSGLGMAVAEGIVREHGGIILARNRTGEPDPEATGAIIEVLLPTVSPPRPPGSGVESGTMGADDCAT